MKQITKLLAVLVVFTSWALFTTPAQAARGTVKFFNESRGFGFIKQEGGKDLFFHYSAIQSSGNKSLNAGDTVEFEVTDGSKRQEASNVRKV